uniref:Uncharacterized protein n=1 Tax=viral metagenome TaxID=1070528 RepID=A0A6M3JRQ5_9ZZZZ
MNISWHLRGDTQTCEWTFRLVEGTVNLVVSLPEFFNLVKQLNMTCQKLNMAMVGDMSVADAIAEAEKLMKVGQIQPDGKLYLRTVQGDIVGELDREYEVSGGLVLFDELLLKGIWPPPDDELVYNGVKLHVESVRAHIGMVTDEKGARGPVVRGITCKVAEG